MTARQRPRRNRLAGTGHAPARPRESRRRIEQIPTGADLFPWRPGELILGIRKRPNLARDTMARCVALYAPSTTKDDAE
jgi:hypothetical protein